MKVYNVRGTSIFVGYFYERSISQNKYKNIHVH